MGTLDKIKSNINDEFASLFREADFRDNGFIPISSQSGFFFIAVKESADKTKVGEIVASKIDEPQKFIKVNEKDFSELMEEYIILNSKSLIPDDEEDSQNAESVEMPEIELKSEPEQPTEPPKEEPEKESKMIDTAPTPPPPNSPVPQSGEKKKIGEILIELGYLTEKELLKYLSLSKEKDIPIGSLLVQEGIITVEQLKQALSSQLGYTTVNASQLDIDPSILNILPEDFIRSNLLIPISSDGKFLDVGMVNPNNKKALNEVVYLTGLSPRVLLITFTEYQECLENYYSESKKETVKSIRAIEQEKNEGSEEETLWEQVDRELEDTSGAVANFANKIIADAIDIKASDVHIEPRLHNYVVRYRIDGILKKVLELPNKVESAVISRFKVLARMNIAEHRRSQDGTFTLKHKGIAYDFRLNTLPVMGKEKMVIRILAPAASIKTEDKVIQIAGATEDDLKRINKMTATPNGIILAVGPTGSGKTTTLYSVLKSLNDVSVNITTIEDPVEIKIEGLNQSPINPKAGITFASCMKAILRQDPDIILVGEIRDFETLETAIAAALTGHLVLSTLHTNSAAATITRLVQMGAASYLISSTLTGVIAQRLVRKLCEKCKEGYNPSLEDAQKVLTNSEEIEQFMKRTIYKSKGCQSCGHEGYKGRFGVYEIMNITKEIKKLIAQNAYDVEIEEAAVGSGMKTLQKSCLGHILRGHTTIAEFTRVLGNVTE